MTVAEDLQYKIAGKVPVWMAAVGLSGGYLLYTRSTKTKAAAAAAGNVATSTVGDPSATSDATDPNTGLPYAEEDSIDPSTGMSYLQEYQQEQNPLAQFLANDPQNPAYPVGVTPGGLPAPVTNAQWATLAENFLISKGDEPTVVMQAIQNLINGTALSAQQRALVDMVEAQIGVPPQPVSPVFTPIPTPKPPAKPPAPKPRPSPVPPSHPPTTHRTFTVQTWPATGSTLSGIAKLEYGNAALWPRIYAANKAAIGTNPNKIRAGMVLVIP